LVIELKSPNDFRLGGPAERIWMAAPAVTGRSSAAAPDPGHVVPPQLLTKWLRQHHRPR